jgi:hypothetical protein
MGMISGFPGFLETNQALALVEYRHIATIFVAPLFEAMWREELVEGVGTSVIGSQ